MRQTFQELIESTEIFLARKLVVLKILPSSGIRGILMGGVK
jgi:hypothetical protein